MIKDFAIFKNEKKEKPTHPDYTISAKVDDKFIRIGSVWLKQGKTGLFFSCTLDKPYNDRKGWQLVSYEDDTLKMPDYPTEEANPDEIPF